MSIFHRLLVVWGGWARYTLIVLSVLRPATCVLVSQMCIVLNVSVCQLGKDFVLLFNGCESVLHA